MSIVSCSAHIICTNSSLPLSCTIPIQLTGDCDTHTDCLGDNYMCFYRDDNELVPGCDNESAVRGVDYCVERTNERLQEVDMGVDGYGRCEGTFYILLYPD